MPRFLSVLTSARTWIGGLVVGALLASTLVTLPAEPAAAAPMVAPATIALTANRTTILAGQTATLTAVTDVAVQSSASTITIVDQSTGATLKSCVTGKTCAVATSFATGGPHTYIATVGALSSETVVVDRAPWAITLTADDSILAAGATTRLVATANQNLANTDGSYQTYIFDNTTETLLGTCVTGKVCTVHTAPFTGVGEHEYAAVVAAAGTPVTPGDVVDSQAYSETVLVGSAAWTVSIAASIEFVTAGQSYKLTATANQDVGGTAGAFTTYIVDTTTGTVFGSCDTGKVCAIQSTAFLGGDWHYFLAVVAESGTPATRDELVNIQAQSDQVGIAPEPWGISFETDREQFLVGTSAKLTARTSQDVGKTGGALVIDIFDRTTGELVKTCTTGKVCSVTQTFASGGEHYYVAAIAAAGTPADIESAQDVRAQSPDVVISRAGWSLNATLSTTGLPANGIARLTVLADQSLTKTNGAYAIYWFNSITGERVGACTTGKKCRATVLETGSTAAHLYIAYVAAATNPATVDDLVDVMGTSNVVAVPGEETLTLSVAYADSAPGSYNTLTAVPNFDMTDNVAIWFFDTTSDTLVGECQYAQAIYGCSVEIGFAELGEHNYQAVIADLTDPATYGEAVNVQARSNDVTVTGRAWEVTLDITPSVFETNQPVTATITVFPAVLSSNWVYLVDQTTGVHQYFCSTSESLCTATTGEYSWSPSKWFDGPGEHRFVAMIAEPAGSAYPITGIQAVSEEQSLTRKPFELELALSATVFEVGEAVTFTVTANQDLDSPVVLYDQTTGQTSTCSYYGHATTCVGGVPTFASGDPHHYVAYLPAYGAESDPVWLSRASWDVRAESIPVLWPNAEDPMAVDVYFRVFANQDVNGYYKAYVYNYTTGTRVGGQCSEIGCALPSSSRISLGAPTPCYVTLITSAGYVDLNYVTDIQAMSGCLVVDRPDAELMASETTGGGNESEKDTQCECADPINTATGEFFLPEGDLGIEGVGPSLDVSRTYSSTLASRNGPFGYGWSANFAMKLDVLAAGNTMDPLPKQVQITQENGATVVFTEGPDHLYFAPERVFATLTHDSDTGQFTFTRQSSEVMVFSAAGRLLEIKDLHGNTVALGYNGSNQVTTLSAPGGRTLTLSWASGRVSQVTDSAGRTVSYAYSAAGNLTAATAVDGAVTSYGYNSTHYMTTVTKPGGAVTTNVYDSSHRVTSQTDPVGLVTSISYAASGNTVTAPGGSKTVDWYVDGRLASETVASATALAAKTSYTYDGAGNILTVTNPLDQVSTFTYDDAGNMLSATDPLGRTSLWTYNALNKPVTSTDGLGRTTAFTYNEFGDIQTVTSPAGRAQSVTYNADGTVATTVDAAGKVTSFTYDSVGRLTSTTDPDGLVSGIAYDATGALAAVTAPDGTQTTVTTDAAGRLLTVMDPNGHVTSSTYDARGNRTSVTDANGSVTSTAYDAADRPTSTTDAAGKVTLYTYTAAGQLATVTDANNHTTTYEYDVAGQLTAVTDALDRITIYEYDKAGRTLSTILPSGAESSAVYDAAGQLSSITDALDETTHFAYDAAGQLISTTDPLGRVVTSAYTDDGQSSTVTLPDSSTQVSAYTTAGLLASFTNADGKVTSYTYSDAGRLLGKVEPGGLATSVSYDDAGRTHTVTLPDGSTQSYSYDDAGQVTRVHFSASGATDTTYVYDDGGRVTSMTDATGTSTFAYDTAGRLHSETDGDGATVTYGYDFIGQLTSITYPGSRTATYAYDAAGQMTSLTDWASHTTTFGWTPNGQLATQTDPNGVVQTNTYDAAGRTTLISDSSTAALLASFGYGYDAAGQLVSDTSTNGGVTTAHDYAYDALSQLGSVATSPAGEATATGLFDATSAGQLTATAAGDTLVYNASQQLTDLVPALGAAVSYLYDANGSRTSSTVAASGSDPAATTTYGYTATGALSSVTTPTTTVDYTVDGRGLRQSRTVGGSTDDFVWSTIGGLPLLLDDGDHAYLYGPSLTPVAQVDDAGTVEYLHADQLGSVRTITDSTGAAVGASTFDAFGARTTHTGTADSLFGFTGNWTDPDTGLVHLRARDYDPATGQFLTVDPAVDSTKQPYAYTGNNPVLFTDPSGLDFWSDAYDYAVETAGRVAQASLCALEQVAAFGAGALDSLTFGLSSVVLGAAVPGYNEFVAGHEAAFTAGSIAATVIQAVVMIIATAGAGAGLAVGLVVLKTVIKSAVKSVVKSVERAVVRTAERAGARAAERTGARSVERAAESCANSFTAGTLVLMADGSQKPIEDVEVGDDVLATDPETGQTESRPVVGVIQHDGEHTMVQLTFDDGTEITATDEHPFWDATTGGFVYTADLQVGEEVLTADGDTLTITGSSTHDESLTAYNLSIAGIHTYYAGDTPVLVHNCGVLPTPTVSSPKLQNIVNNLYKHTDNPSRIGDGTTMAALRYENATGQLVNNVSHAIKAQESANGLTNWLARNLGAPYHDRLVARSLLDDLLSAQGFN